MAVSCSTVSEYSDYENIEGKLIETGIASWYGPKFHGKLTANGEIYNMYEFTAAHKTLPFNSIVRVKNIMNGLSVIVRINDRGPFIKNRIIDLSKKAAEAIEMIDAGFIKVELNLLSTSNSYFSNKKTLYTIQIGSFKNKSDAAKLGSQFSNSRVVKSAVNGTMYYRVYLGEYRERRYAEIELRKIEKAGVIGFVKEMN